MTLIFGELFQWEVPVFRGRRERRLITGLKQKRPPVKAAFFYRG